MIQETTTSDKIIELNDWLNMAEASTTEQATETAIQVYKAAKAEAEKFSDIQGRAKRILSEIIAETGQMKHVTPAGTAQVTAPSVIVSYDTKALDALWTSDDAIARILEPHRTVKERAGSLTIR